MNNVNSALRSVFNDLVEKRLWPVAAALGIALIAIPVVLSKPAATEPAAGPTPPVTPATGSGGSLSAFQPVVNTEGKKSSEIRKNLRGFQSKDPFKVHGLGGGGDTSDSGTVTVEGGGTASAGGGGDTGSGSLVTPDTTSGSGDQGTSGSGDQSPDTTGSAPAVTYYHYTVDVRFGQGDDDLDKKRLENFRALPSSQNPVVVFMGVKDDGETAVFLVSSASSTTGEGDCEPDDTCTFLYMTAGQQQSFEAVDANDQVVTYVLKLLDVNVEETAGPEEASSKSERRAARRAARERRSGFNRRIQAVGF
jgi:hypothetical protein